MIKIDPQVFYVAEESDPSHEKYFFAYKIRIKNETEEPARLVSRHWIIMNSRGLVREVKGEGVVGQQPRIIPGESFEYTSYCPIETPTGSMRGSFQMLTDDGRMFDAPIPEFDLIAPGSLGLMH